MDDVQPRTGCRSRAADVARVVGNLRVQQHNVQRRIAHGRKSSRDWVKWGGIAPPPGMVSGVDSRRSSGERRAMCRDVTCRDIALWITGGDVGQAAVGSGARCVLLFARVEQLLGTPCRNNHIPPRGGPFFFPVLAQLAFVIRSGAFRARAARRLLVQAGFTLAT